MNKKIFLAGLLCLASVASVVGTVGNAREVSAEDNVSAVNSLVNSYAHGYRYQKDTIINFTEEAALELSSIFHAGSTVLERTTYYNDDELWMSNGKGSYSYYGTSENGLTNASNVELGTTSDKVVIAGKTMEDHYYTLRDVVATAEQDVWEVNDGVYSTTDDGMIEVFKGFVAPCYLGFDKTTENYVIFTGVEIENTAKGLVLRLMAAEGDSGKLVKGANNVFAQATINPWHNVSNSWSHDENNHWHECTVEGCEYVEESAKHSGGTATTTKEAECTICGTSYGDLATPVSIEIWLNDWASSSNAKIYLYAFGGGQPDEWISLTLKKDNSSYGDLYTATLSNFSEDQLEGFDIVRFDPSGFSTPRWDGKIWNRTPHGSSITYSSYLEQIETKGYCSWYF